LLVACSCNTRVQRGYIPGKRDASRRLATPSDTFRRTAKIPTLIAIPLGPEGGAGSLGDGVASAATISELKGREMGVANFVELFGATPTAT
jgi:hypothetical protein